MLLKRSWNKSIKRKAPNSDYEINQIFKRRCGTKEALVLSLLIWLFVSFLVFGSAWKDEIAFEKDVWEEIVNSYSPKQKKIWDEVITDSESDSDTDSEEEDDGRPKRFRLRSQGTGISKKLSKDSSLPMDSSKNIVHRLVLRSKVVDKSRPIAQEQEVISSRNSKIGEETHPIISYVKKMEDRFNFLANLSYFTIYQYFDVLLHHVKQLQKDNPRCIIVWLPPSSIFHHDQDLQLIFHHLSIHFIMERTGTIVIPPLPLHTSWDAPGSSDEISERLILALNQQLAFIYKKLILLDSRSDAHTLAWDGSPLQMTYVADTIKALFVDTTVVTTKDFDLDEHDVIHQDRHFYSKNGLHDHCFRFINTRKYDPLCMPEPEFRYPLLVTGLGGSGSHFVANQMQDMGFQLLHESIGKDGAVCWFYSVNDYLMNVTYPFGKLPSSKRSFLNPRFDHVIHVLRNPMDQISSFTAHTNKTYEFVLHTMISSLPYEDKAIIEDFQKAREKQKSCYRGGDCHLHFATLTWIYWNKLVASYADKTYRIEDVGHLLEDLCVLMWPEYADIHTRRRCPDERRIYLTSTWWRTIEYYFYKQFFPSYKSHKKHLHYKLSDITKINSQLTEILSSTARNFNYHKDNFL